SDGKALIGGDFDQVDGISRPQIARLSADGSLDTSFVLDAEASKIVFGVAALARQSDGRVVVGGALGVAQLNTNGSLDGSFSLITQINDSVTSVAIQGDGKVLVGGNFTELNGFPHKGIGRLNTNGSLDVSFVSGIENVSFDFFRISALAVQPDGKILVGGLFDPADNTDGY